MTHYLLELGMEEIPARFLSDLSAQFKSRVETFLAEERLAFETVTAYATPRRLAVLVSGLAEKQADLNEKVKGPALKIARNEAGEWTKAALGFLKGQQASEADIVTEEVNGEAYIFVNKFVAGQSAFDVLSRIGTVIQQMTFPVTMIWNQYETPFIRPVHWIISLLEKDIVPVEFVGVKAGNETRGHRFLGKTTTIAHPLEYVEALRAQYVLVDFEERRDNIRQQIAQIATQNDWVVPIDEDLLEEVTSIVEWPTAFYGEFEPSYLEVPQIVLITAMRDHQRYFYAENKEGRLLPVFISVRNGNAEHLENVIKGNRKVLRARLEDALFFYKEDLKHSVDFFVNKLASVNEHFKLGTLAEKQARVVQSLATLQSVIPVTESDLATAKRAAHIYKFDLMTQTVGEFAELQGQIGAIYAKHFGENEAVAQAIRTQYLPTTSGGAQPDTAAGAFLAFADKLDTLVQYFSVGMIPTGSNDPYALRRQAMGLVEIALKQQWDFDWLALLPQDEALRASLVEFIQARIQQHLSKLAIDVDIVQAVLKSSHLNVVRLVEAANILQGHKQKAPAVYRETVEAITRVVNLGAKVEEVVEVNPALSQTPAEKALLEGLNALNRSLSVQESYDRLTQFAQPIEQYFEHNKVNADDLDIRQNRLATMRELTEFILTVVDPRLLISKF
ncbi:MAG: glycine--tRNA ligase subunit beta [Aerococcaceae bacterium]|nr:glycine--tRNA ligase subunit beta [Aerococcaceae bacterium]